MNTMEYVDRISALPDDILRDNIVARLPLKMAIRTGLLSKRWTRLWSSLPNLDFDSQIWESLMNCNAEYTTNLIFLRRREFSKIANGVVQLHDGLHLRRLRVFFNPGSIYAFDLRNWLKMAFEKGVKEIDLNFHMIFRDPFMIPQYMLEYCSTATDLKLTFCKILPQNASFDPLTSLRSLFLTRVRLVEEMITRLFVTSPCLESLQMVDCYQVSHLRIAPQNDKFKKLLVSNCGQVRYIEINAPHLQTFEYSGHRIVFEMKNISGLQDAMLNVLGTKLLLSNAPSQSSRMLWQSVYRVKIATFSCNVFQAGYIQRSFTYRRWNYTVFSELKELQLVLDDLGPWDIAAILDLLTICPVLERLFIRILPLSPTQACRVNPEWRVRPSDMNIPEDSVFTSPSPFASQLLKLIKFEGFGGLAFEMLLLSACLSGGTVLESLIVAVAKDADPDEVTSKVWELVQFHNRPPDAPESSSMAKTRPRTKSMPHPLVQVISYFENNHKIISPTHKNIAYKYQGPW